MQPDRTIHRSLAAVLAAAVVGATGCGTQVAGSEREAPSEVEVDYTSVQIETPHVSRVKEFGTIEELRRESDLVFVGTVTDQIEPDLIANEHKPMANVHVTVDEHLGGDPVEVGATVPVVAEGAWEPDGEIRSGKFEVGDQYILYLSRFRPEDPDDDVYAVTGFMAGMYREVAPGKFGRVDAESSALPVGIDVTDGGELTEVWNP